MFEMLMLNLGSFPIVKSLVVLVLVAMLVAVLLLFVNGVAYVALAQDDLDKPMFKITGLSDKVFGFLKVPVVECDGVKYSYTWSNLLPFTSLKLFVRHSKYYCSYLRHFSSTNTKDVTCTPKYYLATDNPVLPSNVEHTEHLSKWHLACLLSRILSVGLVIDLSLVAFAHSPIATLSVLGTLATLFATRFISKKLWKLSFKTDNHEERINKLEKSNENT